MLDRVNLQTGQTPTESDWEMWLNRAIDYINAGIPAADILKDAGGRMVVNITGDATSVGGKTVDQIVAGDFPDVKKTLIDIIGGGLVLSGGVAAKNGTTPSQLDITAVVLVMKDTATGYINRVELAGSSKTTLLANATYYLDVAKDAIDYSWGTAHPAGDYVTLASVVTDASANITSALDARPLTANLFGGTDVNLNIETPAGAQAKVDIHEAKPAPHSGHETPAGAQAKADAVQANLDAKLHQTTGHKHTGVAGDGPKLPAASITQGTGSGLEADKIDGKHYNQVAYIIPRTNDSLSNAVYDAGTAAVNNTEVSMDVSSQTPGVYYDLGKNIEVDCININYLKVDWESYWDWMGGGAGTSHTISLRLSDDATGTKYSVGSITSSESVYAMGTGYVDVSTLTGVKTFSIELASDYDYSGTIRLANRTLDIHRNSVMQVGWE